MNIKRRLLLAFAAVACLCGLVTFVAVREATVTQFRSFVFSGDAEKAKVYAGILGDFYAKQHGWEGLQSFLSELPAIVHSTLDEKNKTVRALLSDRIAVADSQGHIVADTTLALLGTMHPATHLAQGVPIVNGATQIGTVLVGSMIDSTFTGANERFLAQLVQSMIIAIAASTAIAILFGFTLSIQITRPLAVLETAAGRIASGDFSVTVPAAGSDEIASLVTSFNTMASELRRLDEARRRIIADSAHELRTPVTLIRGSLEAMIDGIFPLDPKTIRNIYDETMRLSHLIDLLRELELIDSGKLELRLENLSVRTVLEKAVTMFKAQAGAKNIALLLDPIEPTLSMHADALRIDEVLYNLIGNAVTYTPANGTIVIGTTYDHDGLSIHVDDSGQGIPAPERERVFERFYRIDKSRAQNSGGRGLGLSIAYEIVKAHGGTIRIATSHLGGASFVVSLPSRILRL